MITLSSKGLSKELFIELSPHECKKTELQYSHMTKDNSYSNVYCGPASQLGSHDIYKMRFLSVQQYYSDFTQLLLGSAHCRGRKGRQVSVAPGYY